MIRGRQLAVACAAIAILAAAPARPAGFGIFEQGTRAMGLAGAFTAQADDGSALFHNAAGIAFATERQFQVGATLITFSQAEFEGANPFPGEGVSEEQERLIETPPHVYWVQPLGPTWRFGLGVNAPFGLTTDWKNKDQFTGRWISTKAALQTIDLNPTLGVQLTQNFGIGVGAIVRFSDVELNRYLPFVDPFTFRVVDVGKVKLTSDFDTGYGFNAGVLHKVNNSFSWGFSYRSKIKVEYGGDATFTQISTGNPQLDAAVAASLPFGEKVPVETEIEFPDMASLGVAIALSPTMTLEVDANWTGWSSFDSVPLTLVGYPELSSVLPEDWDNAYNYRAGLRWKTRPDTEWRFGYVYDETPQPEKGASPLLPDENRSGFTIGYGHEFSKTTLDLALMYLPFDERVVENESEDQYFGSYNTTAWLLGFTLGF